MKKCGRCERGTDILFPIEYADDFGEKKKKNICWRCDFDLMNGRGKPEDNPADVRFEHDSDDHDYDPLYYPEP